MKVQKCYSHNPYMNFGMTNPAESIKAIRTGPVGDQLVLAGKEIFEWIKANQNGKLIFESLESLKNGTVFKYLSEHPEEFESNPAFLTTKRPWGSFTVIGEGELETGEAIRLKVLRVTKGGKLSIQSHENPGRNELWKIVSGNPEVYLGKIDDLENFKIEKDPNRNWESFFKNGRGDFATLKELRKKLELITPQPGESVNIPKGWVHAMTNRPGSKEDVVFLEIQYFSKENPSDENDIIRIFDFLKNILKREPNV